MKYTISQPVREIIDLFHKLNPDDQLNVLTALSSTNSSSNIVEDYMR